jgi:hypothetical protein
VQNITVRYFNNEKEYGQAMRLYYKRRWKTIVDVAICSILIIAGLILWAIYGYSFSWSTMIGTGALILFLIFLINFVVPIIRYRQEPKFKDEYFLTFTSEGIEFKTDNIDSSVAWSYYNKVIEGETMYLLIYGNSLFSLVPKRVFDNGQEESFRQLLKENKLDITKS